MVSAFIFLLAFVAPAPDQPPNLSAGQSYIPIAAIHSLLQRGSERVTVRATLTRNGSPIYIEDSTEGAAVENMPPQDLKIGD